MGVPKGAKRGPKGYAAVWELFKARFYLNLYDNAERADASINVSAEAEKLMVWGPNHPHIGTLKTPARTRMEEKIREWMLLWPDLN
jgi:hypothetical protein